MIFNSFTNYAAPNTRRKKGVGKGRTLQDNSNDFKINTNINFTFRKNNIIIDLPCSIYCALYIGGSTILHRHLWNNSGSAENVNNYSINMRIKLGKEERHMYRVFYLLSYNICLNK